MGVAGLILGILGVIFSFIPTLSWLGIVMGIVGLILSIVAVSTAKKAGTTNGVAVAGIVLCSITILLSLIVLLACAALVPAATCAALVGA